MKTTYFVTATNTDVGKTRACEIFAKEIARLGKRVGYLKPCETGVIKEPIDGRKMLDLVQELNKDFVVDITDVVPYQFELPAAPYVANVNNIDINTNVIIEKAKFLKQFCDVLIIEGAGGLMVPIKKDYFIADLIVDLQNEFDMETRLITPSRLGSINDTLLSQNILETKGINYSWYINLYEDKDSFSEVTLPFYKDYFKDELKFL